MWLASTVSDATPASVSALAICRRQVRRGAVNVEYDDLSYPAPADGRLVWSGDHLALGPGLGLCEVARLLG
jgi:hypothetical protein